MTRSSGILAVLMLAVLAGLLSSAAAASSGPYSFASSNSATNISITRSGTCYVIHNMTQYSNVTLSLNGSSYTILENFISPLQVGISINNVSYTLKGGIPITFAKSSLYNYTVELTSVSYKPYLHVVSLAVCTVPKGAPTTIFTYVQTVINITNETSHVVIRNLSAFSNVTVNYRPMNATFVLSSKSLVPVSVILGIINETGQNTTIPAGYGKLELLNLTSNSSSTSIRAYFRYRCTYICNINTNGGFQVTTGGISLYRVCPLVSSIIRPFVFRNGIWTSISPTVVNTDVCSLSFGFSNSTAYLLGIFSIPAPSVVTVTPLQRIAYTIAINPVEAAVVLIIAAIIIAVGLRRSLAHSRRILEMNRRILKRAGSKIKKRV